MAIHEGKILRRAREKRRLTQAELGLLCGLARTEIVRLEKASAITPLQKRRIAKALDIFKTPTSLNGNGLGGRLTFAQHLRRIDSADIAAKAGVSPESIRQWRAGYGVPTVRKITLVADALKVPVRWLIDGTDEKYKPPRRRGSNGDAR